VGRNAGRREGFGAWGGRRGVGAPEAVTVAVDGWRRWTVDVCGVALVPLAAAVAAVEEDAGREVICPSRKVGTWLTRRGRVCLSSAIINLTDVVGRSSHQLIDLESNHP